ncbi:MAG: L-sorbosone dehydrogenase [Gemmatimonadetes bacterium]|nr:L-sorbosone dehydrogenase [Gemmatimonadota bacterium]
MTAISRIALPALLLAAAACSRAGGDAQAKEAPPATSAAPSAPAASAEAPSTAAEASKPPACDPGNGGIALPAGFCATVFADGLASPRHVAVAANGDVYVALDGGRTGGGGVMALRDTNGDGKADVKQRFGADKGTGIALSGRDLYFAPDDRVLRYTLAPGTLVPAGAPATVVSGLPTGGHTAKTIAMDGRGGLFVNVGSGTNVCQQRDRQGQSPGMDPCPELSSRAGIWRFDAGRAGQRQDAAGRFATGIRNAVAITVAPDGRLFALQHGRDQLGDWPAHFSPQDNAEKPGEELIQVNRGDDFGWPYCFYDPIAKRKVLGPEYGGDGRQMGRCTARKDPLMAFPGHWAPESIVFYTGGQFPARYRGGAFVAFHGSWNRAPLPQAGYRVVFVPFAGGRPGGRYEDFATGFAGAQPNPGSAHRPMGLAAAPDGSLYVTDDSGGRVWRIVYRGAR